MLRSLRLIAGLMAGSACCVSFAQTVVSAPRSDGAATPLMVYEAKGSTLSCPNLAVLSHGLGGSERGLAYLAKFMSEQGWTAIVMGHEESGRRVVAAAARQGGTRRGWMQGILADPKAVEPRLLDVGAALAWQQKRCVPKYKVLMGHSMGAQTTMLEAGTTNVLGIKSGADRFDAYVALSPQGPNAVSAAGAWEGIKKPMLVITGTEDGGLDGKYQWRAETYAGLPADGKRGCHWLMIVDGMEHADFGGNGPHMDVSGPAVTSTVKQFLAGAMTGKCVVPEKRAGIAMSAK